MTAMRSVVQAAMQADITINNLLTGGIYTAADNNEITRVDMPDAFDDNEELLPCALIKIGDELVDGPTGFAGRNTATIYLYERDSYTAIDQVKDLLYALFHEQKIGDAADKIFQLRWLNNITDQTDTALECNLHVCRYEIVRYLR